MGKKRNQKKRGRASIVERTSSTNNRRIERWKLITGATIPLLAVLIPLLWNEWQQTPPQFALARPFTLPDSGITILALNRSADRDAALGVELDGFLFAGAAKPVSNSDPRGWYFNLHEHDLPDSLLCNGVHRVRVGFAGEALSEPLMLGFSTQAPDEDTEILQSPEAGQFLSAAAIKKLLKERNYFDHFLNESGAGITHQYEEVERDGAQLVVDHATGLTWQKGGSKNIMTLEDAEIYVEQLNSENYCGYDDWRLPTLIEVMSLMEPQKKENVLHIDPVFDPKQRWIWTADKAHAVVGWMVDFDYGSCGRDHVAISQRYVRAVWGSE